MMNRLFLVVVVACSAIVPAQRTYRVDSAGTGNITSMPQALASPLVTHGDASVTNVFQRNYAGLQWTVVLSASVQLPGDDAWPAAVGADRAAVPGAFTYDPGRGGLVVELEAQNTTPWGLYSLDATDGAAAGEGSFACRDGGDRCSTHNGSMEIVQRAPGTDASGLVTVDSFALRAPPNAPSVLVWGLESAAPTPILCATLRATPEIAAFPFVADAAGSIGAAAQPIRVTFPFPGAGFSLAAQYASLDPTRVPIPGALSDAARFSVVGPADGNHVYRLPAPVGGAVTGLLTRRDVPILRFLLP
jgi:hypothetical protein